MSRKLQQEQQGFFRSFPDIKLQPLLHQQEQAQRPFDYQPRVLLNHPIQKKMALEMIDPVPAIPIDNNNSRMLDSRQSGSLLKGESKSPHQKYADPSAYQLVYTKYKKQPFKNKEDCSARKQIELSSVVNYDPSKYVMLRQQKLEREHLNGDEQGNLKFDSRFQCGNLFCAYKSLKELNTYDCFIESDTNTSGYSQWFYFAIQNMKKEVTYRFNLVNMSKAFSFFKKGMKPTLFSTEKHKKDGNGWFQKGYSIKYKQSDIYDIRQGEKIRLFCLTFQIDFTYDHDYITISHGPPYSYSRLIRQLKKFRSQAIQNDIEWIQQTICHTISNNQVPYLVISKGDPGDPQTTKKQQRKVIVIMARQHSGEINSSIVMENILHTLANSQSSKVQWLLSKYQFRIFPMINVDGVIYGNFRCDLVGFDLNRCWRRPIKQLQPQILAIKKEIEGLSAKDRLVCCIDLHSHSKQLNIFSYCNRYDEIQSRLFSLVLSKQCNLFHFPSCTFGLSKEKQTTARAVIGSLTPNQNTMTIECSSFGFKRQNQILAFSNKSYEDISLAILASLKVYFSNSKYRKSMLAQIQQNLFKYKAYTKKNSEANSGSDSQPACVSDELQKRLKGILPRDLLDRICKKAKEDSCEVARRYHRSIEYEQSQAEQPSQIKQKTPKILPKRNSFVSIQQRNQMTKNKQFQLLSKKNTGIEVGIRVQLPVNLKPSKVGSGRLKTEPRITHRLQRIQSNEVNQDQEIKTSTPNKIIDQYQNGFKKSMKILYRELRSNRTEQQSQSSLLIDNGKEFMEKREVRNENKLEAILKIRRKAHNFKSILSRGRQTLQEVTLLKIRSEHASTAIETIPHSISPFINDNCKLDRLIKQRQAFPRDRYNSHIAFLNKYLRSNIKQTLRVSQQ